MTPCFALFEQTGRVESMTIITECDTDQSKGFAVVDMGDEDAEQVIAQLNGTEVGGRLLTVNAARPRKERSGRRGDGGHHDESDLWRSSPGDPFAAAVRAHNRYNSKARRTACRSRSSSVCSNPYRGERRTSARFRLEANARTFNSASRLRTVALVVGVSIHHPPRRST
jgi:RNA recognition motif-containing protein